MAKYFSVVTSHPMLGKSVYVTRASSPSEALQQVAKSASVVSPGSTLHSVAPASDKAKELHQQTGHFSTRIGVSNLFNETQGTPLYAFSKLNSSEIKHVESHAQRQSAPGAGDEPRDDHGRWTK